MNPKKKRSCITKGDIALLLSRTSTFTELLRRSDIVASFSPGTSFTL